MVQTERCSCPQTAALGGHNCKVNAACSTRLRLLPVQELEGFAPAVAQLGVQECELLYGRAGYLYAWLFARRHALGWATGDGGGGDSAAAQNIAAQIVDTGERGAAVPRTAQPSQ